MPHWRPSHLPDCTRPAPIESRTSGGKRLAKCPDCQRYWFPDARPESSDGQPEPETPEPEIKTTPARYVCRTHQSEAVRPNGRGCQPCAQEQAPRTKQRSTPS